MEPKKARKYAQLTSTACPCCGGAIGLVYHKSSAPIAESLALRDALGAYIAAGGRYRLLPVEEMEEIARRSDERNIPEAIR